MRGGEGAVRSFANRHKQVTSRRGFCSRYGLLIALGLFGLLILAWFRSVIVFSQSIATNSGDKQADYAQNLGDQRVSQESIQIGGGLRVQPPPLKGFEISQQQQEEVHEDGALVLYSEPGCKGEVVATLKAPDQDVDNGVLIPLCEHMDKFSSMKLVGDLPEIDFYASCTKDQYYIGSLFKTEGCVKRYNYPNAKGFKYVYRSSLDRKQISGEELEFQFASQDHKPYKAPGAPAKYRIVFSCESSEYFGYQVWANYYGYLTSQQQSASWTRLLTSGTRDDLPDTVKGLATFQAKRSLYSRRYSPINKPDVITKWYESPDRPTEEIIVVIDPDNWLLKDVSKYVDMVSLGNAVGEPAYYFGSRTAQKLWKEVCEQNCDRDLDLVGVPYIVHREDLAKIAPLWRYYTILLKDRANEDPLFNKKYGHLDLNWASEMFGYNFAAAHVGVAHKAVHKIQVRDVDSEHRKEKLQNVAMLHVGRAWFPASATEEAARWAHTEGKNFLNGRDRAVQVWCKCNNTAAAVIPWPVPEEADFQSTHTLRMLHESMQRFGPIPVNLQFRRGATSMGRYGDSVP